MRRTEQTATHPSADWVQDCLKSWADRELSQVRFSAVSLVLDFWGSGDDYSAWLYADKVHVTTGDGPAAVPLARTGAELLGVLHGLLGSTVTSAAVDGGDLLLAFSDGTAISVEAQTDLEGWAVVAEAWGTITCAPDEDPAATSSK